MKYSMVADIMYVAPGEHGPVWPDTDGILQAMALAKENGLDAIEIFDFAGRDLEAIAQEEKRLGIGVATMSMKDGKLWGIPGREDDFVKGLKDSLEAAGTLGVDKLVVSDELFPREAPRKEVHDSMVLALKKAAPVAEEAGVTIIAEPLSGCYFRDASEPFDVIREVGSDHVKLLYDIFHFQLIAGDITNTIRNNLDLIGHVHGAGVPERNEITKGEVNYRFLLKQLNKAGYDQYFGLEFFTFTDREQKVRDSVELLRSI